MTEVVFGEHRIKGDMEEVLEGITGPCGRKTGRGQIRIVWHKSSLPMGQNTVQLLRAKLSLTNSFLLFFFHAYHYNVRRAHEFNSKSWCCLLK